ncbi:MAG: alpha/beta hydrolase [Planctomycetes bacterium]|nr:alpha/beta hydrolase [Planctomycetota bacterium]
MSFLRRLVRSSARLGGVVVVGVALAFLLPTPGRFAPPALFEAGARRRDFSPDHYPPGTEQVELSLVGGERLRGVFVPSDPGAPVVLHLLESSGSVTSPLRFAGYDSLLQNLADVGFASLAVDYRGIGASDGERSVTQLALDVDAMWNEAVRRAGGPDHVVLRGLSLGTLSVGIALANGAKPAGVVLIAPVRAETVVANFAAHFFARPLGWLSSAPFRPVIDLDLVAELARTRVPILAIAPADDELLDADETASLRAAIVASGGRWVDRDGDHVSVVASAHRDCRPEELVFLRALYPEWPDEAARVHAVLARLPQELVERCAVDRAARARLAVVATQRPREKTEVVAALVALDVPAERVEQLVRWRRSGRIDDGSRTDASAWLSILDTRDPSGELPYEQLELFPSPCTVLRPDSERGIELACVDALIETLRDPDAPTGDIGIPAQVFLPSNARVMSGVALALVADEVRATLPKELDARRQLARMLLKGEHIPDRIVRRGEEFELEAFECGVWRRVELEWPAPPRSRSAGPPGARANAE